MVFTISFKLVGFMGQLGTFLSMSDIFTLQPARRYVTQAFTQRVASALSSLSFITVMSLPIIRVSKITGTLEAHLDKSGMTRAV